MLETRNQRDPSYYKNPWHHRHFVDSMTQIPRVLRHGQDYFSKQGRLRLQVESFHLETLTASSSSFSAFFIYGVEAFAEG